MNSLPPTGLWKVVARVTVFVIVTVAINKLIVFKGVPQVQQHLVDSWQFIYKHHKRLLLLLDFQIYKHKNIFFLWLGLQMYKYNRRFFLWLGLWMYKHHIRLLIWLGFQIYKHHRILFIWLGLYIYKYHRRLFLWLGLQIYKHHIILLLWFGLQIIIAPKGTKAHWVNPWNYFGEFLTTSKNIFHIHGFRDKRRPKGHQGLLG